MKSGFVFLVCLIVVGSTAESSSLVKVNDDNWDQILSGEWMIEFFAPWCPACRNLDPVWSEFATWGKDLGIQVAQVDITHSPGLSGRFMITALPTIFHIKEGSFRQYRGSRSKEDFLSFVEEKKWEELEPLASWQSPSSIPMTMISQFYRVSMVLRNVLTVMVDDYGIPSWAGYLIFGLFTILIGLFLGLLLVCVIDFIYPPPPQMRKLPTSPSVGPEGSNKKDQGNKDKDDEDSGDDDLDEEDDEDSEGKGDRESQDDSQASESEMAEQEQRHDPEPVNEPPRRRKVRRAD